MSDISSLQHQTLTVRHPDGGIIVPVEFKVQEAVRGMTTCGAKAGECLYAGDFNGSLEWGTYHAQWQSIAISWASR